MKSAFLPVIVNRAAIPTRIETAEYMSHPSACSTKIAPAYRSAYKVFKIV